MDESGILGPNTTLAHGVWIAAGDAEILAQTGTNLVINPASNLRLKNGITAVDALHRAGVAVSFGSDNTSAGDVQNIFQAMKLYALLSNLNFPAGQGPNAANVLEKAILNGAYAVGLRRDGNLETLGEVKVGAPADLVLLDAQDFAYLPLNDVARQIVYSESGRGVHGVIVGGDLLIKDRQHVNFDQGKIAQILDEVLPKFVDRARRVEREAELIDEPLIKADAEYGPVVSFGNLTRGNNRT